MTPTDLIPPGIATAAFALFAWFVKRIGDAIAARITTGDPQLVAAVVALRTSVDELKNLLIQSREENRFLRESFSELVGHVSDLVQRWRVADAIHELHNQEGSEIHSMTVDLHKAVVDRPTGVHRVAVIQKQQRERASTREDLLRQSQAPPARRRGV